MANTDNSDTGLTDLNPNHGGEDPVCVLSPRGETSTASDEQSVATLDAVYSSSLTSLISPTNQSAPTRLSILPAAPHPKKYNAVNISKKFLQKNSSSSGTATTSSNHVPIVKSGSPARTFNTVFIPC